MARVKVPVAVGVISVFTDGVEAKYEVGADGVIEVADDHLASVLAAVAGSVDVTPAFPEPKAPPVAAAGLASEPTVSAPPTQKE